MAVEFEKQHDGRLITVRVTGKLSKEDYERFAPETEQAVAQFGKIRMLVEMRDFQGWEAGALWQDIKFDAQHFSDISHLALVGENKWQKGMSVFCKPFTTATVRYFDLSDIDQARKWIASDLETAVGT